MLKYMSNVYFHHSTFHCFQYMCFWATCTGWLTSVASSRPYSGTGSPSLSLLLWTSDCTPRILKHTFLKVNIISTTVAHLVLARVHCTNISNIDIYYLVVSRPGGLQCWLRFLWIGVYLNIETYEHLPVENTRIAIILLVRTYNNKLMKGKSPRKHSPHEKTAASVLLKLFISSNEWCHTTDVP